MSGEPREPVEHAPDHGDPAGAGDAPTWEVGDEAMHRLLEEAFETLGPRDEGHSPRFLTPFLQPPAAGPDLPGGRELSAGETLGRFRIEGELGRGGFGVVYRATDAHLGRTVALKVPRPDRVQSVALWDRFAREARLAAMLDHDAIVPVLDAGILDGLFVLVSAYQEGEPLSRWLAARHPAGMPPRLAASMVLRMAGGLEHAHGQGVLHRDLKPSNVLMAAAPGVPEGWLPRITDFGLGTILDEGDGTTLTGFWQGSPPYMAPEQVLPGLGRVDARADLYALGAILYEMLTGRPIYPRSSLVELSVLLGRGEPPARPRRLRPGLPADLETICLRCLERDPSRRYPSAAALRDDLLRFLDGRPILARPIPAVARLGRWARRRPSHAALVALAVAASVFTAGLLARHERQLADKNRELFGSNARLLQAVAQRDSANAELRSTLDRLLVSERTARRTAFAADLRLAADERAAGRVEVAQTLLRRHEPAAGQEDLRDFTWRYLVRRATRTYAIHPLSDFRWWRGARPLAPTVEGLDPLSRSRVQNSFGWISFDPDGIRSWYRQGCFLLGPRYLEFSREDNQGGLLPHLRFNDGRRRVPLELPGWRTALGPGGRTLALVNADRQTKAGEAPQLVRHPDLELPAEAPGRGSGTSVRIVEVARSIHDTFSGDGGTLACLASDAPESARPLIYDLGSDWRASYPQYKTPFRLGEPGVDGARRIIEARIVLSHDGRLAALIGQDPRIRVFETRTGRTLWCLGPDATGPGTHVTCSAFDGASKVLVTGDSSGRVRVWDATRGDPVGQFPVLLGYTISVGFHPDPETVAIVGNNEDAIRFWKYRGRPEPPSLLDHGDEVWGLAFTRDGGTLVSVGDDDGGKAWDLDRGEVIGSYRAGVLQSAAAADRKGCLIATGDFDGVVALRRGGLSGPVTATSSALRGTKVRAVALSPTEPPLLVAAGNGPRVLVASADAEGRILRERLVDTPHPDTYALAFSPDGGTLAMGSHARAITLWDTREFRHRATLSPRAAVTCAAYSPDGGTLVSGDIEGGLQFWDLLAGTLRTTRARASETGGVWALAFNPDGKTLATGGDDRMVRLWDSDIAIERLVLSGHEAKVHAVAFSPDGKTLASGDFQGKVRLWRTGP